MCGYTEKWSVDTIEELIDNGHFEKHGKGDIVQAINELNVHYKYENISKERYNYIKHKLENLLNH